VTRLAELERDLGELGRVLAFPPTPEVAEAVRARIAGREGRRRRAVLRRPPAVALAVVAALLTALAIALAVPPARSAILRVFGIGGVRVELVDELPERPLTGSKVLGERVDLAEARRRVDIPVRLPAAGGFDRPDAIYVSDAVPGGAVFLVYGPADRPRALLTEFATGGLPYVEKSVHAGRSSYRPVEVAGAQGGWIEGEPHLFLFSNRDGRVQQGSLRLATNTLVWERGGITYRLEGKLTLPQALRVARSVG
jgi:hypothetical protein